MAISRIAFSLLAADLASRCKAWSDGLSDGPPERIESPMYDNGVKIFVEMVREAADHIEAIHNEPVLNQLDKS